MYTTNSNYINLSIESDYLNKLKENNFNLDLIDQASEIINRGKSTMVYKTTRAGLTTSSLAAAKLLNKKVLILEPTHGIRENTINKVPEIVHKSILPNKKCLRLQQKFIEDPDLEKLFYSLPDCEECSLNENCEVTEFLRSSDYDVVSMTYKKLEALILSRSKLSNKILDKLNTEIDLIIFDEAHVLNYNDVSKINYQVNPSEVFKTKENLRLICVAWNDLKDDILDLNPWFEETNLDILEQRLAKGKSSQTLAVQVYQPVYLKPETLKYAQKELLELAENRYNLDLSFDDIERFRDLINFFNNNVGIFIIQIVGDETLISGLGYNYVQEFIKKVPKQVLITSATLYEKNKGFFGQMVGSDLEEITFQDLRRTDDKVKITPSKYKMDYRDKRAFKNMIRDAKEILDKEGLDVYLVAMNSRTAKEIQLRLNKDGYPVKVDYYRSSSSLGVENENRVCIAFGMAEVPVNTFDAECINSSDPLLESRRLRYDYVLSSTWQAWSRVKDPEGLKESKIYALGVRSSDCQNVIRWGKGRTSEETRTIKKLPDGEVESLKFTVEVKEAVGLPVIEFEAKSYNKLKRNELKPEDFINQFVDPFMRIKWSNRINNYYYNNLIWSSIDKSSDFYFVNTPENKNQLNFNAYLLDVLFCNRRDQLLKQNEDGGYRRKDFNFDEKPEIISRHLKGLDTIASYQISMENKVVWLCFDIDCHNPEKEEPSIPRLRKIQEVLDRYRIDYLVEASGSPDSYHIWIFCLPISTLTAYKFVNLVKKLAGVNCETFPKQKSIDTKTGYGNFVKPPLGINRKNGNKSMFLNKNTLEPEDKVFIPKIVHFNEIPDEKWNEEKRSYIKSVGSSKIRNCLNEALYFDLSEGDGHQIRIAVAIDAIYQGLTDEEIADLFKYQPDFNRDISLKYVQDLRKRVDGGYKKYSCETLSHNSHIHCEVCHKYARL